MPARLHFSNSLEVLADRLIRNLGNPDPFASPIIAYPNAAVRDWLKVRIAEKSGIAVNIDFESLENLLWKRLEELDPFREAPDRKPAQKLEKVDFQGLILNLLRKNPPSALREYLEPGAEPRDAARKLCQLSGRLASLFREYEFSRVSESGYRGLAETWNLGLECFSAALRLLPEKDERRRRLGEVRKLEDWQREIYRGLFQPGEGLRDRWGKTSGIYRYTLPQYAEMVWRTPPDKQADFPGIPESPTYHLFGLSQVSPFHRDLIRRLADAESPGGGATRFEIYALNPCAAYWDDIRLTPMQLQAEELPDLPEEKDNVLLARFGKPGRETIALWHQITEYDSDPEYLEPTGAGVLPSLRRALLQRRGPLPDDEKMVQDDSLLIRSAPNTFAEAEAVKEHLLGVFRDDKNLRPEEVGIALGDPEALSVVRAAFAGFPLCVPEAGMRESVLFRGFRALLDLALGPLRPESLMDFLENPCITAKFDTVAFRDFLAEAGFQEGWDEAHRAAWGAAPGSQSTIEEALHRALYGLILDAEREEPGLPPASGAALKIDREQLALWLQCLEKLNRDLAPFRSGESRSFSYWGKVLKNLLREYFLADPGNGESSAHAALGGFFRALENWGEWENGGDLIPHTVVTGLIEDHFRDTGGARGSLLSEGLRVGSLQVLRGLPFRRLYILGLNAGVFPRARPESAYGGLDLRSFRRVLGESNPATHDLYAFLEAASAVESLALSYVRREDAPKPGNPVGASYAVTGLIAYLESDLLKAPFEISHLGAPRSGLEDLRLLALAAMPPHRAAALALEKAAPPLPRMGRLAEVGKEVDLNRMQNFLRNPLLQAYKQFRLEDSLEDEGEQGPALSLGFFESKNLLTSALCAELASPGSSPGKIAAELELRLRSGKSPPPPHAVLESERLLKWVGELAEPAAALRSVLDELGLSYAGTLRLGSARMPLDPPILSFPPLAGSHCDLPNRFRGIFKNFFRGKKSQGWALLLDTWEYSTMGAYILHLCATACSDDPLWKQPGHVLVHSFKEGKLDWKMHRLPALETEAARRDFRALTEDFLRAPDMDHLPLARIEDKADKLDPTQPSGGGDWKTVIEDADNEAAEGFSFQGGSGKSASALMALDPRVPADAGIKISRRLAPLIRWSTGWEKIA